MANATTTRFLLGITLLHGCGPGGGGGTLATVVDSAGVELVTLGDLPVSEWRVAPEPELAIGSETGEQPDLFERVVAAMRMADGSTLICNGGDRTLRRYDRAGEFLGQAGGAGGGPSELRVLNRCFRFGSEIWAYQAPFQPIKVYTDGTTFVRSIDMPRPADRPATLMDVLADGALLLRQDAPRRDLPEGSAPLLAHTIVASPQASGFSLDTIAVLPGGRWVRRGPLSFPQAFTPSLRAIGAGDVVVVSWPASFDLAVLSRSGRLVRRLRRGARPLRVDGSQTAAFRERVLTGPMPAGDTPYQSDRIRRDIVDMMEYPAALPAHYRLLVDRVGNVWVERGDAPRDPLPQVAEAYAFATTWDVLSLEGAWTATVVLPPGFDPLEIGADYVLGVHHDDLGVERVHAYALAKGTSRQEGG